MRLAQLFGMRLRALPEDVHPAGLAWLIRAGYAQRLTDGRWVWLPLGQRVLAQLKAMLRAELDGLGGQAVLFNERRRGSSLGPGEEAQPMLMTLLELGRHHLPSYKNLPAMLYDAETDTRVTLATFGADAAELEKQWHDATALLFTTAQRCGLAPAVLQDLGGVSLVQPAEGGEVTALVCPQCGYRATQEAARMRKVRPKEETPRPLQKVATPGASTIAELCAFLNITPARTAKALLLMGRWPEGERLVFVVIRGDMEVNLAKVQAATGAQALRPATEEEIRACGAEPGYASPIGVRNALVVVDELIPYAPNLVAGANEAGYHLLNVTYGSDFQADVVADLALVHAGDACPTCGAELSAHAGMRLARGYRYETLGGLYQAPSGQMQPWHATVWELDLASWTVAIAQRHHDAQGLHWPVSVAPFVVHLVVLGGKSGEALNAEADQVAARLRQAGVTVLLDDRVESAGVKFTDADLLGIPLRVLLSERTNKAGGVEIKLRGQEKGTLVALEGVVAHVLNEIQTLHRTLEAQVIPWIG